MSVQVVGLTKHYGGRGPAAISDVTFEAKTGAVTALLGPSGREVVHRTRRAGASARLG